MKGNKHEYIIKTLVYADIFDYPLTLSDLWRFLIHNTSISKNQLEKELLELGTLVKKKNSLFYLNGRENIVSKRTERERYSKKKMIIVNKICSYITFIPSVYFIGVSGSLAMQNAKKTDDIDLFIIAQKNTVWITRFIVLIVLQFFGVRRQRNTTNMTDTICVNMLLDESVLQLPKKQQNLYTAHEVVQVLPIFERNDMYNKFLEANLWVREYLPNSIARVKSKESRIKEKEKKLLLILEWFAKASQKWYMKQRTTGEVVSDSFLAFYPSTYYKKILRLYNQRLKVYTKL